jgi:probable HAF family extracellular repeat protein
MKRNLITRYSFLCLLLLVIFIGLGVTAKAQSLYTITKIGPLPDHVSSLGHAINNAGDVAGWSNTVQAYHWSNGILTGLPPLEGGDMSRGEGIGESGVVLGSASSATSLEHAAVWLPAGSDWIPIDLGVGPGDIFSMAHAINSSWVVCGYSDDAFNSKAAVWDPPTQDSDSIQINLLPMLSGHVGSIAFDLNNDEVVVGLSYDFGLSRAVSWIRPGGIWLVTDLGALHPYSAAGANAVNSSGTIVGWAVSPNSGDEHAVQWQGGNIEDLGRVEDHSTYANGINNNGDVVGEYWDVGLGGGFVQPAGHTTLYDLQNLIPTGSLWTIRSAQDINDSGQITGIGDLDGFRHSFLLTPITMTLTGPIPGIAGEINTWTVTGATPGRRTFFFASPVGGETLIPGCGSITLDLADPIYMGYAVADGQGNASFTFFVPAGAEGFTFLFQALDYVGRMVTNVTQHTF